MTVKELKNILDMIDENAKVYVNCQGYTNLTDPDDEYMITVADVETEKGDVYVFIGDGCFVDINEEE